MSRTMLVTGASSGIGRAVAERALARGWRVGLFARRKGALEEVAASGEALVLPGDVTERADVARAVNRLAEHWGRLDALFNNAGIFTPAAPVDEISDADWDRAVAVNLTGMFNVARAAFGQMRRQSPQGGRIINNGSISAHAPRPGAVTYTTTKHAITGLTKSLSLDGRSFDIACGQIDIGNAETDLVRNLHDRMRKEGRAEEVQPVMDVAHAADAVMHMADLPLDANVQFMTVMATKMPFIGRG